MLRHSLGLLMVTTLEAVTDIRCSARVAVRERYVVVAILEMALVAKTVEQLVLIRSFASLIE